MLIPAPNRDSLRVQMLEQRLRELPRGPKPVAQLRDRDRPIALRGRLDDDLLDGRDRVGVVVQRAGDADRAAGVAQRFQVAGVELGIERRLKAGRA